jgi:hypothetical protein
MKKGEQIYRGSESHPFSPGTDGAVLTNLKLDKKSPNTPSNTESPPDSSVKGRMRDLPADD